MALEATPSMLGAVLKDCYCPVFQTELDNLEVLHECGSPFEVRFLDRDGEVFSRDHARNCYTAVLTAICPNCRSGQTAYNYCRIDILGRALYSFRGSDVGSAILRMLKVEIEYAWEDLKRHMIETHGVGDGIWSTEIAAEFAEWFTKRLTKGRMNSIELKHELEYRARYDNVKHPWSLKKAMMLAHKLDFVVGREPFMYYMLPERVEDVLIFGLPPEHPLALAA